MNVEQLISPAIPTLVPADTGNQALALMEENNVTELPVVLDDNYIGLVLESDVLDWTKPGSALSGSDFLTYKPAIIASGHPFEALRLAHQMNLSVLPVIDKHHKYIGAITKEGLLKYITENSGIDTPGGIIVLEISPRDYTLVEIARICENEDVIIMNTQVHANENGKLDVTLKVNRTAIEAVVSSFERHNYIVKEVYGENTGNDDIAGKYNLLMNYINM
jgi:acetoin utilization protein AcuB